MANGTNLTYIDFYNRLLQIREVTQDDELLTFTQNALRNKINTELGKKNSMEKGKEINERNVTKLLMEKIDKNGKSVKTLKNELNYPISSESLKKILQKLIDKGLIDSYFHSHTRLYFKTH